MTTRQGTDAVSLPVLQRRIRVALGQEPADLLLTNAQVVNVFTGRVEPGSVAVADGWIAGVGPFDWRAKTTIDLGNQYVVPGFIDSHQHLESTLLSPGELARMILPHGTTATISDSHEVGNVLGIPGIEHLINASEGLPFDLFFMASSCVPATEWEHAGAVLGSTEVTQLLDRPRVLGLAEMMNIPAVLRGDGDVLKKIQAASAPGRPVDGHTPAMFGRDLMAYVASGIRSDHESGTVEEARAKASWGMMVQVREGSIAHNLDALTPLLVSGELGDDWTLVTDDILPDDLRQWGHINGLLRRVVAAGVPAPSAVRHSTLIPARYYGLKDRGAVAPGYRADLVVMPDLKAFAPTRVFKDGHEVARDGACVADIVPSALPCVNSIHLPPLNETRFRLAITGTHALSIRIVPGQLVTKRETVPIHTHKGEWAFDPSLDVALIASVERHRALGTVGVGLTSGFGFKRHGALGSSVAHDSHNVIVTGTNAADMLACTRALADTGGGFVVVSEGEVRARLPLPFAGLLSTEHADVVCRQLREVRAAAGALGCPLGCPFGMLSFLALSVIPELRITDQGLWDVVRQQFVQPALP